MDEPIADEVRGILDGHVVLDRTVAARGRYPAVDVTVSLSRVMDSIVSPEHRDAARRLRALVATFEAKRDLVTLGAYAKGSDRELDEAIARMPRIEAFLRQDVGDRSPFDATLAALASRPRALKGGPKRESSGFSLASVIDNLARYASASFAMTVQSSWPWPRSIQRSITLAMAGTSARFIPPCSAASIIRRASFLAMASSHEGCAWSPSRMRLTRGPIDARG